HRNAVRASYPSRSPGPLPERRPTNSRERSCARRGSFMLQVSLDDEFRAMVREAIADALKDLPTGSTSWRERVYTCPGPTLLSVGDVAEAVGRTKAFVYRHTRNKTIRCRRLDGELVFLAGDVR